MKTEAARAFDSANIDELRGPNDLLQSTVSQRAAHTSAWLLQRAMAANDATDRRSRLPTIVMTISSSIGRHQPG